MKRVYLAGPMSGHPDLNFPAFHRAAASLRASGYEVLNPAELVPDQTTKWEDCMRKDIAALVTCDGIALLPGWENSRGAQLENLIASRLGMRAIFLTLEGRTT
jgi:nucleoside 2-deoxyribosyltransferase